MYPMLMFGNLKFPQSSDILPPRWHCWQRRLDVNDGDEILITSQA